MNPRHSLFALLLVPALASAAEIPPGRLKSHVRALASNGFHGRGPTQIGERPTLDYLVRQMKAAGLSPAGPNGSWLQPVPMIRLTRTSARISVRVGTAVVPLRPGIEVTATASAAGRTVLVDVPMIFGGYGVIDRKLGFDPFDGVDLRGKVVVLLWGDPDVEAGRDLGFGGRAQTFAGRTGEKVAALQGRGVAGIVTIHEDFPASYPFSQIARGDAVPLHMLDSGQPIPASGDIRLVMRSEKTSVPCRSAMRGSAQTSPRPATASSATTSSGCSKAATARPRRFSMARIGMPTVRMRSTRPRTRFATARSTMRSAPPS